MATVYDAKLMVHKTKVEVGNMTCTWGDLTVLEAPRRHRQYNNPSGPCRRHQVPSQHPQFDGMALEELGFGG
jgi:phage baseplate assembly protein gpV